MADGIENHIRNFITKNGKNSILIHSDLVNGMPIRFLNRKQYLKDSHQCMKDLCLGLDIIVPTFNYDFCKGEVYDVVRSKSQVGVYSEYYRNNIANWRSSVPIFSFSGTGKNPPISTDNLIDPFGNGSMFDYLYQTSGLLMHYGSSLDKTTLLHYVERKIGNLIYRYDKIFNGILVEEDRSSKQVSVVYHVRPKGKSLDYDWRRIEKNLIDEGIIVKYTKEHTSVILGKINDIVIYCESRMIEDPFYLLDDSTKRWVLFNYDKLKRPFELDDFE